MNRHGLAHIALFGLSLARHACGLLLGLTAFGTIALGFDEVPEIDPGSMVSALTLLLGSALMLTGPRRKKVA